MSSGPVKRTHHTVTARMNSLKRFSSATNSMRVSFITGGAPELNTVELQLTALMLSKQILNFEAINIYIVQFAESEDFARRIFPATQIKHGCINLPRERLFQKMTRSAFVEYIQTSTKDIAERAAKISLANWGGVRSDITHLVSHATSNLRHHLVIFKAARIGSHSNTVKRTSAFAL